MRRRPVYSTYSRWVPADASAPVSPNRWLHGTQRVEDPRYNIVLPSEQLLRPTCVHVAEGREMIWLISAGIGLVLAAVSIVISELLRPKPLIVFGEQGAEIFVPIPPKDDDDYTPFFDR